MKFWPRSRFFETVVVALVTLAPVVVFAVEDGAARDVASAIALSEPASSSLDRWQGIEVGETMPDDWAFPEGKTRWDLSTGTPRNRWDRGFGDAGPNGIAITGTGADRTVYRDTSGQGDERRWLLPHLDNESLIDTRGRTLRLERGREGAVDRLWVQVRRVGNGWAELPGGPREVVLQRAIVYRAAESDGDYRAESLVHRWIDPRHGVVAEIGGPATDDGNFRSSTTWAAVQLQRSAPDARDEASALGGAGFRIYADEHVAGPLDRLSYGLDAGQLTLDTIAGQTPGTGTTIWDFVCDPATPGGTDCQVSSWDFSGINKTAYPAARETASTTVPLLDTETCSDTECGFTQATRLGREDKDFDRLLRLCEDGSTDCLTDADCTGIGSGNCVRGGLCDDDATQCIANSDCTGIGSGDCTFGAVTVNGLEQVDTPGVDSTIYLRAVVRNEAETQGGLGENESRVCYFGGGRSEVPLFRYGNVDGSRYFVENGDSWTSAPFDCDNSIFNHVCPSGCGFACSLYIDSCSGYSGTQGSQVVNEGTVTLPSGHTFNALVVRTLAEFCVYLTSSCSSLFQVDQVRQAVYLWEVPQLGTAARLMSAQDVNDPRGFTSVTETDIKFGLLPPLSITVGAVDDTSVALSWDPGLDTSRIGSTLGDYRIYWDTDSGISGSFAFDSITNSGQAAIAGTSAVISGLMSNTQYFFTVTSLSDYRYPTNGPQETYESLLFPTQIAGGPSPVPAEVTATTDGACTPTEEVVGLTADRSGNDVVFCWEPVVDPCIEGYRVLGAASPEAAVNFTTVEDVGLTTCSPPLDSGQTYFLVVGRSAGETGPTGHHE